jgi:ubiquinone/menaquinone biosynthesis C-methylase UbiE
MDKEEYKKGIEATFNDISTGTGSVAIEAIDLSLGMLEVAQTKARDKGITNIVFRQCDVDSMSYDNHTFDIVTCGYGMWTISSKPI